MTKTRREPKPATDKNTSALTPSDVEELDRASPADLNAIMSRCGKEIEETTLAEKEDADLAPLVAKVKELRKPYRDDIKRARQMHKEAYRRLRESGAVTQASTAE